MSAHAQASSDTVIVNIIVERGVEGRFDTLSVTAQSGTQFFRLQRARGDVLQYAIRPAAGYKNALILIRDSVKSGSGRVRLEKSMALIASADKDVRLRPANRALYQLYREQLTAPDPVVFQERIICATERMIRAHGDSAHALMDEAAFLAVDPIRDSAALRRIDRALANRVFRGCRNP